MKSGYTWVKSCMATLEAVPITESWPIQRVIRKIDLNLNGFHGSPGSPEVKSCVCFLGVPRLPPECPSGCFLCVPRLHDQDTTFAAMLFSCYLAGLSCYFVTACFSKNKKLWVEFSTCRGTLQSCLQSHQLVWNKSRTYCLAPQHLFSLPKSQRLWSLHYVKQ